MLKFIHRKTARLTDRMRMSRKERRALALLIAIGATGHAARIVAADSGTHPDHVAAALFDPAGDGNPSAHLDSIRQQQRPLGANERIDVDHAGVDELTRLPGIGPALAKRIVADRQSHGAFESLEGLGRVPGLGRARIAGLAPHLSFGGIPAEAHVGSLPDLVDLNLATGADLAALPGIGPKRARAIVAFRDSVGPFRQVEDLRRVPGLSAALIRRLAGRLVVP